MLIIIWLGTKYRREKGDRRAIENHIVRAKKEKKSRMEMLSSDQKGWRRPGSGIRGKTRGKRGRNFRSGRKTKEEKAGRAESAPANRSPVVKDAGTFFEIVWGEALNW